MARLLAAYASYLRDGHATEIGGRYGRAMNKPDSLMPSLEEAIRRARAEYLEMPGLQLTIAQAARLWQLDLASSEGVLSTLVECKFLMKTRSEAYARA
jgi:hypothetical protein